MPVQADGPVVENAALNALIVEVDVGVSRAQLPGSPSPSMSAALIFHMKRVLVGGGSTEDRSCAAVGPMISCQKIAQLNVSAMKHRSASIADVSRQ